MCSNANADGLSRSVLVQPRQPLDAAAQIVERLKAADPVTPAECLLVADAINALACVGMMSRRQGPARALATRSHRGRAAVFGPSTVGA